MVQAPLGLTSKSLSAPGPSCPSASLELARDRWAERLFFFRGEVCSFLWTRKHITSFPSFCSCNKCIEVYCTYHKKLPLQVDNGVSFSNFTEWHSCFHKWVSEHFHCLVRTLVLMYCSYFHPTRWQPRICFLSLWIRTWWNPALGVTWVPLPLSHGSDGMLRPSGGGHWLLLAPRVTSTVCLQPSPRSVLASPTGLGSPGPCTVCGWASGMLSE